MGILLDTAWLTGELLESPGAAPEYTHHADRAATNDDGGYHKHDYDLVPRYHQTNGRAHFWTCNHGHSSDVVVEDAVLRFLWS